MTRQRNRESNSFNADEVERLLEMHRRALRGDDVRTLACCSSVLSVVRKFQLMRERRVARVSRVSRVASPAEAAPVGRSP